MKHRPAKYFSAVCLFVFISCNNYAAGTAPVKVKTVSYQDVAYYPVHTTAAEVIAKHDSKVSAEISAAVTAIRHDTGDKVSEDETVIELDCRTHKLLLQQAKASHDAVIAQYNNAKKLLRSAQKLQKQNNIARELYDQREADASRFKAESLNTKAGIEAAAIAVEKCNIKAPYDGYISQRYISKGEYASPGTALFQIVASEKGRVEANINTFEYKSFNQGNSYQFIHDGISYDVVVDSILPILDKKYRTHTARLSFVDNPAPTGSHGELKWRDRHLTVPSSMVVTRNQQAGVLVAEDNKVRFVPVESFTEGHPAFIQLQPDTRIITIGRHGLNHGDSISIMP